jgi:Asp-tRNA(Asn)/Glu-tRNA(Gln) amidotransferase A subunit family amidase
MDTSLKELTIARAQKGYRNGTFTARQVVEYYLQRIKTIDQANDGHKLNSILAVSSTTVEEADALDVYLKSKSQLKGSLHGIPVVVKDQASTKGLATSYGSILAKDYIPEQDATLVTKLKAAGAIILAKTTMPGRAKHEC